MSARGFGCPFVPGFFFALLAVLCCIGAADARDASATPYQTAVLGSNPTSYFRFAESSGTTGANQVATGPSAIFGTPGVTLGRPGADGDTTFALGSTGFVSAPDTAATAPTGDLAVEAWVKPGAMNTPCAIVEKYGRTGATNNSLDGYQLRVNANSTV